MTQPETSDSLTTLKDVGRMLVFVYLVFRIVAGREPAERWRRDAEDRFYAAFGRAYLGSDE